jgi:hypothetical protein
VNDITNNYYDHSMVLFFSYFCRWLVFKSYCIFIQICTVSSIVLVVVVQEKAKVKSCSNAELLLLLIIMIEFVPPCVMLL